MRLDKYLKVSRLIKRRTVANEACDNGRISVNGRVVKASSDVKVGDKIEIALGAEVGTDQDLENTVPHMGQTQIGDGVDILPAHVHFKKVFHICFPLFRTNWAQRPVKMPVMMLQTIIMGR